uniref:50MGP n=1 Tax=Reticulitermes flavipes TaxID=36989 RepID=S5ZAZ0_RETFL|nr:50MGP [Reticulitermes flavipes]
MKTQAILIAAVALLLGTEGGLIKPSPGTAGDLLQGLTRPAPNTRKVLPNLVLSPALAKALYYAQISLSSTIQREAKLINKVPEKELVLDDLHIAIDDDISVQLSNLKLLNVPSIDVTSANANLEFLNLALDIDFGTLQVGGNFEVVSKKTLAEIPVTSSGEFILRNSPFKGTGKVGLSLQTNFYKTINYDVVYQPTGSYLTVSYLQDNERIVSALEVQEHQEAKVVAHINRQLKNVLNRLVQKRLDDILAGVPVDKLIGETRTAESYRKHARRLTAVANDYVDKLLNVARSYIGDKGLSEVDIPNIDASFSKKILFVTFHGSFTTRDGHARNLATLTRTSDITLDYNTGGVKVFGSVGLTQLELRYNRYEAKFQGIGPSGTVDAKVGSNSIFLKVNVLLAAEPSITLEDVHIEYVKDINIKVTGLGILDWILSKIVTWITGLLNDKIISALDSQLQQHISGILSLVDPTEFFR